MNDLSSLSNKIEIFKRITAIKDKIRELTHEYYKETVNSNYQSPFSYINYKLTDLNAELKKTVYELEPFYKSKVEMFRCEYASSEMHDFYYKNGIIARTLNGTHFSVFNIYSETKNIIKDVFELYENNYSTIGLEIDSYAVEFIFSNNISRMIKADNQYCISFQFDKQYIKNLDFDSAFEVSSTLLRELKT